MTGMRLVEILGTYFMVKENRLHQIYTRRTIRVNFCVCACLIMIYLDFGAEYNFFFFTNAT